MVLSIALICMIVAFVAAYHFSKKPKKQSEKVYSAMTAAELVKFMKSMHCELVRKIDDHSFVIGFQGGYFQVLRENSGQSIQLFYKDFYACGYEQAKKVIFDVNTVNHRYTAWSCYLYKAHEDGESETPFVACLSACLFLLGSETHLRQHLRLLLEAAFAIARDFKEMAGQSLVVRDALGKKEFDNRMALLRRKLEMGHGELKEPLAGEYREEMLRMEGVLSLFEEISQEEVKGMTLISGERVEKRTELLSILSFRLKDAVLDESGQGRETAFIHIELLRGHLAIVLEKAPGGNRHALYYKLSVMRTEGADAFFDETQKGRMLACLLEFRLTTENEDYWELKYMVDDAREKSGNKQFADLTEEQQALLAYSSPTLQSAVYWGKKLFCRQCYLQALGCYLYVFRYYQEHWPELSEREKEEYYVICYHIGFVNLTLGYYEKAFYYLTNAKKNSSVSAIREFTNCLVQMKDTGAIEYIYSMVSLLNSQIKMYGDEKNVLLPLYNFLRRRAAQVLVSLRYFTQARELLYQMLGEEENKEFARRELKYLESLDVSDTSNKPD